ncbi:MULTISPECIES: glycoside hydrolase family 15 protein [unclassified Streptomyces]|uniref:glycoside hydrolase family 15 protein n=1 Tax=unclassified Streptomyces TaxID=2593676 RepID=UPI0005A8F943|nr:MULTISPECIES: glycoside hydrolase family 15 protein [unclassified Streptomyces]ODA70570.1 Trehalase [Streptomyces sp. AVP053U2]
MSTPIADYGMLADGSSAALVDRRGSIDWMCVPRFDSPALFARLLDPDAGHWSITPTGRFEATRRYLPGTLVIETTFTTASGAACLRDTFAVPEGQRGHDLGMRPPHELLREIEGLSGEVVFDVELVPRPEYGLVRPLLRLTDHGMRTYGGPNQIAVRSAVPLEADEAFVRTRVSVTAGQRFGFSLVWAPAEVAPPDPTAPERVSGRIADTVEAWRSWEAEHDIYHGPHRDLVLLSSRVLKGLTYRPTGAIVAAPTTSLPETAGGERNWDYRFAWIRDASLTLEALYHGTCPEEAADFVSFMTSSAGGSAGADSSLQIMYGVGGEHDLTERLLPHLRGWRDSRPVRIGNAAWAQTQLDVYGELLNALHLYRERLGDLHPEIQRFAAGLADTAARRWREPDAGMWEMRGTPRHHLSSKVLCWVALDRAVKLAPRLGSHARTEAWAAERDCIRQAVIERGWSERRGAYTQAFDSDELDAAALLMPLYGFLPATDERMYATIEAIARELTDDGLVLRYRLTDDRNVDGLAGSEGTFVLCSFWLASALAQAGCPDRAKVLFDRVVGFANDLGLLAEEIDPRSGELLGNFPQAFSHVGLINAAAAIDQADGAPPRYGADPSR